MNLQQRKIEKQKKELCWEIDRQQNTHKQIVKEMHRIALEKAEKELTDEDRKERLYQVMLYLEKELGSAKLPVNGRYEDIYNVSMLRKALLEKDYEEAIYRIGNQGIGWCETLPTYHIYVTLKEYL